MYDPRVTATEHSEAISLRVRTYYMTGLLSSPHVSTLAGTNFLRVTQVQMLCMGTMFASVAQGSSGTKCLGRRGSVRRASELILEISSKVGP
jgi:hypothetical protein